MSPEKQSWQQTHVGIGVPFGPDDFIRKMEELSAIFHSAQPHNMDIQTQLAQYIQQVQQWRPMAPTAIVLLIEDETGEITLQQQSL